MTHSEKRKYLIKGLLSEFPQYNELGIPDNEEAQKRLLRSLMNIRPPRPVSEAFLKIQDEYLGEAVAEKGVIDSASLPASSLDSRLVLWRGDITTLKIDAIVNAANSALRGCFVPCHSCVDNIIHSVSGIQLRLACDKIMKEQGYDEPAGKAKITSAYNLPSEYVLHSVGPIVSGRLTDQHCRQLADCYKSCLYRKKAPPKSPRIIPAYPPAQTISASDFIISIPKNMHPMTPAATPAAVHPAIITGRKTDTACPSSI